MTQEKIWTMNEALEGLRNGTFKMEVGMLFDYTLNRTHLIGNGSDKWGYRITFVSSRGTYEATRLIKGGKLGKRVIGGIWIHNDDPRIKEGVQPGGVSAWGNKI